MTPATTRLLLAAAVLLTAALIAFAPSDENVSAPASEKGRRAKPALAGKAPPANAAKPAANPASARPGRLDALARAPLEDVPDLFKSLSWYVPPPPPPPTPPPPPPPPTAPPLPFAYLGQYLDGNTALILLTRGDRLLSVAPGDIIDRVYQVGRPAGGQLTFTYLPLHIEQSLTTGVSR
jgi:hypothetical protein